MYYRLPVQLQQMRDLTGTDRRGSSLLGLANAAERFGFSPRGVKAEPEHLRHVALPAIAHVRTAEGLGHFIVIYRVSRRGSVLVGDPRSTAVTRISANEFRRMWTGYLLLLAPETKL